MEIWKRIKGYENYLVSNKGKIKRDNHLISSYVDNASGYVKIGLSSIDERYYSYQKKFLVHRLVAEAFIPNPENKPEVNHIDGNKQNNNVSNLEWVTHDENIKHASKTGLMIKVTADVQKQRKISGEKLKRYCRSKGLTQNDVAEILEISLGSVRAYYLGLRSPKDYLKQRMQERLGLDISYVFYDSKF